MLRSPPGYSARRRWSQTVPARDGRPRRGLLPAFAAALLASACATTPRPCRSPSACPKGHECLADRCLPLGAEPVAPDSRRLVLDPTAVAVVRPGGGRHGALPPTVTFGGPPSRSELLLVEFAHPFGEADIDTAFLWLEPALDAEPSATDVELGVAVITDEWASGTAGEPPSSSGPNGAGIGRTRPPAPLRIDVTALVREVARRPQSTHGFVLQATSPSPRGAVYSTGIDGPGPRLDVYLRPRTALR